MKRVLLALALLGMTTGAAMADPDDLTGGVFILHAPPGLSYSVDPPTGGWCGTVWQTTCEGQDNQIAGDDVYEWVWYILSNFWESKTFKAVEYGIVYDPDLYLYAAGLLCTPSAPLTIEYPGTGSWPSAGSGISIALQGLPYWSGAMVTSGMVHGFHYTYMDPTTVTLGPMPASGSIGWLSATGGTYTPACIGAIGIDMPGRACCSEEPQLPQACCFPDGHCVDLLAAVCEDQGGVVYPNLCAATECPQPPQACCFPTGFCVDLLPADCVAQGGVVYPELCATTVCPQPPEPQACCFPDGSCLDLLPDDCVAQGGVVYPELCATTVCPQPEPHACCFEDGSCLDLLSAAECQGMGGVWYPAVTCETPGFICPQPVAACCFDFDNNCYMQTEADCVAAGGTWYAGMDCASFTCPLWAVCCVGEVCHITTAAGCADLGGEFRPTLISCDPNPCVIVPADPSSWGSIKSIYR